MERHLLADGQKKRRRAASLSLSVQPGMRRRKPYSQIPSLWCAVDIGFNRLDQYEKDDSRLKNF
jgi:hypothetical protein